MGDKKTKEGGKPLKRGGPLGIGPISAFAAGEGKIHVRVVEKVDLLVEVPGTNEKDPYCELFIHFTNNTKVNFTVFASELSFMDRDGGVLDRNQVVVEDLGPGKIRMVSTLMRGSECSEFSYIKIEDFGTLDCWIDGKYAPSTGASCGGYFKIEPSGAS